MIVGAGILHEFGGTAGTDETYPVKKTTVRTWDA
jgi:hypothetical protein